MGEQQNLTEENVEELKAKLDMMKKDNPDLRYRFYQQAERAAADAGDPHKEILDRIDALERLVKTIFDGHVLIDGRFQKITP